MTEPFNSFVERGGGKLAYRFAVDGFKYEAVTAFGMNQTMGDGRIRQLGLSVDGVKLTQKADPITAKLEAGGATFRFVDLGDAWTAAFNTYPENITWLNQLSVSVSASSMTVLSTDGWETEGVLHLNQEAMRYSILDSTTFSLEERGIWGSQVRAHYSQTGADIRYPEITSNPVILEGRRCYLYAYTAGDNPLGDGTLVWQGVVSGEPKMVGPEWRLMCDSLVSILDSELGADIEEPITPRGIYYPGPTDGPSAFPPISWGRWGMILWESNSSTVRNSVEGNAFTGTIRISGHFETTTALVNSINEQLYSGTIGWSNTVRCVEDPGDQYHFEYTTGGTARGMTIWSWHSNDIASLEPAFIDKRTYPNRNPSLADPVATVNANTTYYVLPDFAGAPLPKGVYGRPALATTYPLNRIYLGGTTAMSEQLNAASIDFDFGSVIGGIESRNLSERYIDITPDFASVGPGTSGEFVTYSGNNPPQIKLSREYNATSVGRATWGLMNQLTVETPDQVNLGIQPAILASDWEGDISSDWYVFYSSAPEWLRRRTYQVTEAISIADLLCPDLQLASHFLSLTSEGKLTIKPLRFASQTESVLFHIDRKNLIGFPSWEGMPAGNFSSMVIRDNYNAAKGEWESPPLMPQDVTSLGRRGGRRAISIEAKSRPAGINAGIGIADAVALADQILGIYGNPYAYVTCEVNLQGWTNTYLGAPVSISTHLLPSYAGSRGVDSLVGIVIGREISPYESKIQLTILTSIKPIVGYAAQAIATSITGDPGTSITFNLNSAYFADGDLAANHFIAGDRVYAFRFDSSTLDFRYGTVVSSTSNSVSCTMDSTFTEGSDTWILTHSTAQDGATTNQQKYCYLANDAGQIPFATAKPAYKLNSGA